MNVEEIFIHHKLYGNPGMTHVTSDGEKLYFLQDGHLMYVEAEKDQSFAVMSEEELNRALQEALLNQTKSH